MVKQKNTQEDTNFITFSKRSFKENLIFVCSGLNNLCILICHYYFIYRFDDVRIRKKNSLT